MSQDISIQIKLDKAIAAREADLIALTQALVRIPTLNPPGENYLEICQFLADRLTGSGFTCQLLRATGTPGDSETYPRWNVIARRDGGHQGDCVHFNSHIDVVDVGMGWTKDPFGGELIDGKIYGRGTCDMKGGLAASIIAAEAFLEICPEFSGSIEISGTADEESGGFGGVAWLAAQGHYAHVNHVIIPEPLGKDSICLGHRGVWWAEIETKGEIAHGSMPFLGDCAVRHMGAVIREFEDHLFPALAQKHTAMPVIPPGARQSTLNINSVHGGQTEIPRGETGLPSPVVPDSCRMVIDRRFLIEESLTEVQSEITDILDGLKASRPDFDYSLRELQHVLPSMTDRDAPVVTTVGEAIAEVFGHAPEYVVSPGTYDQKHIDRIGRLSNCIAYGPGKLELAHKPDEYVEVSAMMDSARVMGRALLRLLPAKQS